MKGQVSPFNAFLGNDIQVDMNAASNGIVVLTPAQVRAYPETKRKKRFVQRLLGNRPDADRRPLELFAEDGFPEGYLTDLGPSDAAKLFDYNTEHRFPSSRDIVRIACFFRAAEFTGKDSFAGLVRLLALLVKGEFERHLAFKKGWKVHFDLLSDVLRDGAAATTHLSDFRPPVEQWAKVLDEHGGLLSRHGLSMERLNLLVRQLIHAGVHRLPNDGPEVRAIATAAAQENLCYRDGDASEQTALMRLKHDWLKLRDDLGNILFENEQLRLAREHMSCDWMARFGKLYQRVRALAWEVRLLEYELLSLETGTNVDDVLAMERKERDLELRRIEASLGYALHRIQPVPIGGPVDEQWLIDYRKQIRSALSKLKRLTHIDCLKWHPSFHLLTDRQRQELDNIFQEFKRIDIAELCHPPGTVGYDTRGLERVTRSLDLAKSLLQNAGIDVDVTTIIEGVGIQEKISWLERETKYLEACIKDAEADHAALLKDEQVNIWKMDLATPEKDEARIAGYEEEALRLETERDRLLRLIAEKRASMNEGDEDSMETDSCFSLRERNGR